MDFLTVLEGQARAAAADVCAKCRVLAPPGLPLVEPARAPAGGDFTIALAVSKADLTAPQRLLFADKLAERLRTISDLCKVDVEGPGFLNLTVAPSAWEKMLAALLNQGVAYGRGRGGQGKAVDIGFLPVGKAATLAQHDARCSAVGDALANLLDFGDFRASRDYRVNGEGAVTITVGQPVYIMHGRTRTEWRFSLPELALEIGADAARFGLLMHRNAVPATLDPAQLTDPGNDNPLFRVQYAHARCRSVGKRADLAFPDLGEPATGMTAPWDNSAFEDAGARLILCRLALYPRQIDAAARAGEPSWLTKYLLDLAAELHAHYYRSLAAPHLRFIRDDDRLLTGARLALVRGVETVLKSGLTLLGVCAPDEIR